MRRLGLGVASWLALGAATLLGGCDNSNDDGMAAGEIDTATETNVTRLACTNDSECAQGESCVFANADAGVGQCSSDGEVATTACVADADCALGEACNDGECGAPAGSGGPAGGTCLAGDPSCADLGPADQPSAGAAGGTCLAGDPSCADLGPADQPSNGPSL